MKLILFMKIENEYPGNRLSKNKQKKIINT